MLDNFYDTDGARGWTRRPKLRRGLRHAFWGLFEADASLRAAGVAFYAFLSLFPALAAGFALFALAVEPATIIASVERIAPALPVEFRTLIADRLAAMADAGQRSSAGFWLSTAVALWSGSRGVDSLLTALSLTEDEAPVHGFLAALARALAFTLGAFVVIALLLALSAVLPLVLERMPFGSTLRDALNVARWPVLAALLFAAHLILYRHGPKRTRPPRHSFWPGAMVATALWLAGSAALSFYVHNVARYDVVFGSIAGVAIVMFWLYALTLFTLFGARMNAKA